MIVGLIPAAGHSRRMGRPKLALPLAGRSLLEHVVGALREGGAGLVLVVLAPHVVELVGVAQRAGAEVLMLPEATPDMRTTVERGLDWIEMNLSDVDAILLSPADHPTLDPLLVRRLIEAETDGIVIPVCEGKRGHPALISWRHVTGIRALPADQGLNTYLRAQAVTEIVADGRALLDIDTPEDYERLLGMS